jgi:hypothetical protein
MQRAGQTLLVCQCCDTSGEPPKVIHTGKVKPKRGSQL